MGRSVVGGSVSGIRPTVVVYAGPGDLFSPWVQWYGLRAFSLATAGNVAIKLRRDSDNAELDFNTLPVTGNLDLASITTWAAGANLFATRLYDQTGNGIDVFQNTAAKQPAFIFNGIGSLPVLRFNSANVQFLSQSNVSPANVAQPITLSTVVKRTANFSNAQVSFITNSVILLGFNSAPNTAQAHAGATVTGTATDNVWHALQGVLNGASSELNVDGTSNLGNAGGAGINLGGSYAVSDQQFGLNMDADWTEAGAGQFSLSSAQCANMSSQQHAYWGF